MSAALIGAIAAPIIGGLMGQDAARSQVKDAKNARAQALAQYAGIDLPSLAEQKLNLETLQSAGELTPEMEQALSLGSSAMEQISADPRLKAMQMSALEQMAGVAEKGMSPADMAAFELARKKAASENQAMQAQILQNMQARGQGGSGAELIARLKGAQSAADSLQDAQLEQARQQQAARMQAMSQLGNMSTQVRQQDVGEQSDVARAKDLVSRFNLENQQGVGQRNVGSRNQAQAANLQNQQNILNQNVALRNQQQQANKQLLQQQFNNQLALASGRAGQYQGVAQAAQNQAANTAGMYSGIGQGVGTALAGFANYKSPTPDAAGGVTSYSTDYLKGK